MLAFHQTLPMSLLGIFLSLGAIYLGYRTQQRRKGSPKRSLDLVVAAGEGVLVVLAIALFVVKP
jgi:multisubunit Na+/H+ antiporter MnhB subunit